MEAIVAAARWGGEIMMKPGELRIEKEGALADLLLVDGDPVTPTSASLQDPDCLLAIMKAGRFHKETTPHRRKSRTVA